MESILKYMEKYDYENLFLCQDKALNFKAIIAVHDTTLGPATGGCRMWRYESEMDAIEDASRLARGMTYKYAAPLPWMRLSTTTPWAGSRAP